MKKLDNSIWRFTLVHRYSLRIIDGIFVQGTTYKSAKEHLYNVFPRDVFDIHHCLIMPKTLVMVSPLTSEVTDLLHIVL